MPPCISTRSRSGICRVWICSSWPPRTWKNWECIRLDTRSSYWRLWKNSALWWGRKRNHACMCTVCVSTAVCIQEAVCCVCVWIWTEQLSSCLAVCCVCSDIRAETCIFPAITLVLEGALVCRVEVQPEYTTALITIHVLFHWSALRALSSFFSVWVHCFNFALRFYMKIPPSQAYHSKIVAVFF